MATINHSGRGAPPEEPTPQRSPPGAPEETPPRPTLRATWKCGKAGCTATVTSEYVSTPPPGWSRAIYLSRRLGREESIVGCTVTHAIEAAEQYGEFLRFSQPDEA